MPSHIDKIAGPFSSQEEAEEQARKLNEEYIKKSLEAMRKHPFSDRARARWAGYCFIEDSDERLERMRKKGVSINDSIVKSGSNPVDMILKPLIM